MDLKKGPCFSPLETVKVCSEWSLFFLFPWKMEMFHPSSLFLVFDSQRFLRKKNIVDGCRIQFLKRTLTPRKLNSMENYWRSRYALLAHYLTI